MESFEHTTSVTRFEPSWSASLMLSNRPGTQTHTCQVVEYRLTRHWVCTRARMPGQTHRSTAAPVESTQASSMPSSSSKSSEATCLGLVQPSSIAW